MTDGRMRINLYNNLEALSDEQLEGVRCRNEEMIIFYQEMIDEAVALVGRFPSSRMSEESAKAIHSHQVGADKYRGYNQKINAEMARRNN